MSSASVIVYLLASHFWFVDSDLYVHLLTRVPGLSTTSRAGENEQFSHTKWTMRFVGTRHGPATPVAGISRCTCLPLAVGEDTDGIRSAAGLTTGK